MTEYLYDVDDPDPFDILLAIPDTLEGAASGKDVVYWLRRCLETVRGPRRPPLTIETFETWLSLVVRAEIAAHEAFPKHYMRDVHHGMRALADHFAHWAGARDVPLTSDERFDIDARLQILHNIAVNLGLQAWIESRAHERRELRIHLLRYYAGGAP
jgi:hypothetical protein